MRPSTPLFAVLAAAAILGTLSSCASGLRSTRAGADQGASQASSQAFRRSPRVVALFLVDGLSVPALQAAFRKGLMPHTRRFFLRGRASFPVAQAAFPTQTYPNLSSILTARPIGEQPVVSNHVVLPNGKLADYESASQHEALRALVEPLSVFSRLGAQGRESASFSYVLGMSATHHMRVGVNEGLEYRAHDYEALDGRLLGELEAFLRARSPREWPDFLYVHLVGVDATAHAYGSLSPESMRYLAWLDKRLGPVLRLLEGGERGARGRPGGRQVVTALTSDHGFDETERYVSLRKKMVEADLDLVVTNEARFLGLYLPAGRDSAELSKALRVARESRHVELTAWRRDDALEIEGGGRLFRFTLSARPACGLRVSLSLDGGPFRCAHDFDDGKGTYPFLVSQLARYLTAPGAANALVIAKPGVSFAKGAAASHGGPTARETLVPALLRNASFVAAGPAPTSELLRLLDQAPAPYALPSIENMKAKPTARQARAQ